MPNRARRNKVASVGEMANPTLATSIASAAKEEFTRIEWLEMITEEYKSLRVEVLEAGKNALIVLRFGLLVISSLLFVALNQWDNGYVSNFVLLIFCPASCYLVLFIWTGEIARRFRAGHYIQKHIEDKLAASFASLSPPLQWENWIRQSDPNGDTRLFRWHRKATIILFYVTAIVSFVTGFYKSWYLIGQKFMPWIVFVEFTALGSVTLFLWYIHRRIHRW